MSDRAKIRSGHPTHNTETKHAYIQIYNMTKISVTIDDLLTVEACWVQSVGTPGYNVNVNTLKVQRSCSRVRTQSRQRAGVIACSATIAVTVRSQSICKQIIRTRELWWINYSVLGCGLRQISFIRHTTDKMFTYKTLNVTNTVTHTCTQRQHNDIDIHVR